MLACALALAACGADATTTETTEDLTNDAPESLADAGGAIDEPTELSAVIFVDEAASSREPTIEEVELAELILADLNALGFQWESEDVIVDAPTEQTGDITTVLTYTATAWTSLEDPNAPDEQMGARVVYDMIVNSRVTTADGVVLDQAIVNDCLNLDFCPDGVSRDTVTIERIVSFDRVDLFTNCVGEFSSTDADSRTVTCS